MAPRLPRVKARKTKMDWSQFVDDEPAENLVDRLDPMEARCEMHTEEIEALSREIRSPGTASERRIEAVKRRDAVISTRKLLMEEIASLRTRLRACIERNALDVGVQPTFADHYE